MKKFKIILAIIIFYNIVYCQVDSAKLKFMTFYYPNGFKLSQGYFRNNQPDGYWITYYVDGKKKSEGNRKNYLLDSLWIFYAQNGDTVETINYLYGKKNGFYTKYYTKADTTKNCPKSKELFVDDKKQGYSYYYYNNSKLQYKIKFKDNIRDGEAYEYDKEGNLTALLEYRNDFLINRTPVNRVDSKGQRTGQWVELHDNGKIKKQMNYVNGLPNGVAKEFSPTGKIIKVDTYVNGTINSELTDKQLDTLTTKKINIVYQYYQDKRIKSVKYFNDSIPVGLHIFYNQNGKIEKAIQYNDYGEIIAQGIVDTNLQKQDQWSYFEFGTILIAKGNYTNNKKQGEWFFYYPSGNIRQSGFYDNDKPINKWTWYYETGKKMREENYIEGLLNGETYEYSPSGDTILKCSYFDGQIHGQYFSKIGEEVFIGKYVYDSREGEWQTFYYPENKLKSKSRYIDNKMNGQHREYYKNQKLKILGQYSNDKKQGKWIYYREDGNIDFVLEYSNDRILKVNDQKIE